MSNNDKDLFYIYLEAYKKYVVLRRDNPSDNSYLTMIRQFEAVMVHDQDRTKDISSSLPHKRLDLLKLWLKSDKKIDTKEKDDLIKVLDECSLISYIYPSLSLTKELVLETLVGSSTVEALDHMLVQVGHYNEIIDIIKAFMKKHNPNPVAFYHEVNAPQPSSWTIFSTTRTRAPVNFSKLTFKDNEEKNIFLVTLIPKKIELKKSQQDLIKYLKDNDHKISRTTLQEDKKSTAEMFVVHTHRPGPQSTNTQEGFLGKDNYYGPLNTAELFYDNARAIRAAKARGVQNYQVWRVNLKFKDTSHTSDNFAETGIMQSIISLQEQELIEEMLKTQDYKKLELELAQCRQILKDNNLLPEVKESMPIKKNKI